MAKALDVEVTCTNDGPARARRSHRSVQRRMRTWRTARRGSETVYSPAPARSRCSPRGVTGLLPAHTTPGAAGEGASARRHGAQLPVGGPAENPTTAFPATASSSTVASAASTARQTSRRGKGQVGNRAHARTHALARAHTNTHTHKHTHTHAASERARERKRERGRELEVERGRGERASERARQTDREERRREREEEEREERREKKEERRVMHHG